MIAITVIAGATGVGKTRMAIELAKSLSGELVGADSVQVYRGFDIGAAKPHAHELGDIPHHLIDVCEADAPLDAAAYADLAHGAITDITSRGKHPIVVGGTGLWIRALLRGLVALPPVDAALRARLYTEAEQDGAQALYERLVHCDPLSAKAIHPHDLLRITRALEVFEQTGTPLGVLRAEHAKGAPRYQAQYIVLDGSGEAYRQRLRTRSAAMFDQGWVAEVQALLARFGPDVRALQSVGYREVVRHVLGELDLDQAQHLAVKATLRYARHQRTWFRSDPDVTEVREMPP